MCIVKCPFLPFLSIFDSCQRGHAFCFLVLDSILVGVKTPTESHHDCGLATCRARPAIFQDPRWHDIRAYQVNDPASKLRAAFKYKRTNAFVPSRTAPDSSLSQTGEDDRSLEQLFFPLQTWTSWQYRRAYPKLFEYVRKGTLNEELQCEVLFEDFLFDEHEASLAEWPSTDILLRNIVKDRNKKDRLRLRRGKGPIDLEDFWNQVKSRFKERKVPKNPPTSTKHFSRNGIAMDHPVQSFTSHRSNPRCN